jgi:hypothetical protein
MQLSPHFTLAELTASKSHPHVKNEPNQDQVLALEALCDNVLEPVRLYFGRPVIVSSGFRSPELNRLVGSKAKRSQHMLGEAADFEIPGVANVDIFYYITEILKQYDQCIAEMLSETNPSQGWIHVSWSRFKNRQEKLSYLGRQQGYVPGLKFAS